MKNVMDDEQHVGVAVQQPVRSADQVSRFRESLDETPKVRDARVVAAIRKEEVRIAHTQAVVHTKVHLDTGLCVRELDERNVGLENLRDVSETRPLRVGREVIQNHLRSLPIQVPNEDDVN